MTEYHNPENVPESAIPEGWQFIPKDQFPWNNYDIFNNRPCRAWNSGGFDEDDDYNGSTANITYIIKK